MATPKRKAPNLSEQPPPDQPAAAMKPAWRQPPPRTRADVRRKQIIAPQAQSEHVNPLAPIMARVLELGDAMALRHWIALLVLAGAAYGTSQLFTLPQFTVTAPNVRVRGLQRASVDEVYAASQLEGINVFRVEAARAAGRVVALPGVASAEVHVRLPANVIIDVVEFAPIAIVQTITETLWIGSDGRGIQQVGEPPKLTLVEVSGTVRDQRGSVLPEIIEGLVAIHSKRPDLAVIHYGTLEGLYFRAAQGYTVYLGEGGAMSRKLALLEATQQQLADGNLHPQEIDLRFDGYAMLK
jgi:cell division septal protein FtsQ